LIIEFQTDTIRLFLFDYCFDKIDGVLGDMSCADEDNGLVAVFDQMDITAVFVGRKGYVCHVLFDRVKSQIVFVISLMEYVFNVCCYERPSIETCRVGIVPAIVTSKSLKTEVRAGRRKIEFQLDVRSYRDEMAPGSVKEMGISTPSSGLVKFKFKFIAWMNQIGF
jgi:hypothetical protein